MSGGVDSTAAAVLLRDQGFEVVGATMLLWRDRDQAEAQRALADKARSLAERLGIKHYVIDLTDAFYERVVLPFMASYRRGETPNPCVLCNRQFKFSLLPLTAARLWAEEHADIGTAEEREAFRFDYFATGHYARVIKDEASGEYRLYRAKDPKKDQSYVLYGLSQDTLSTLLLPLGELSKETVRQIASDAGTPIPKEEESQDICFITHSYKELLENNGGFGPKGWFVNAAGEQLAPHPGIGCFTLGQRKHLGHAFGKRVSIVDIDPQTADIVIGDEDELYFKEMYLDHVSFNTLTTPELPMDVAVSARYQQRAYPARLSMLDDGQPAAEDKVYVLRSETLPRAACPGQAAVFYVGNRVIGGGTIIRRPAAVIARQREETARQKQSETPSAPPLKRRRPDRVKLKAPAKLNLHLQIFDRGGNGLHALRSVMQTTSLFDIVELECEPAEQASVRLYVDRPELPSDEGNLAFRAARAWLDAAKLPLAVRLRLHKRVPFAAGLGGGSSDAAAVLLGLQRLAGDHALPSEQLAETAASLGSDVSFFLTSSPALVEGDGSRVSALPALPALPLLLVKPRFAISTAEAYRELDEARAQGLVPARPEQGAENFADLLSADPKTWAKRFFNDFEPLARKRYPELDRLLGLLNQTSPLLHALSGSGPSVFALYEDKAAREEARRLTEAAFPDVRCFEAETCSDRPEDRFM